MDRLVKHKMYFEIDFIGIILVGLVSKKFSKKENIYLYIYIYIYTVYSDLGEGL